MGTAAGELTEPQPQCTEPPQRGAALVRKHPCGDRVEPRELELLRRSVREAAATRR